MRAPRSRPPPPRPRSRPPPPLTRPIRTLAGLRAAGVDVSTVYFTPIPEDVIKRIALACESAGGNGRVEKEIGVYIHHFDGASDTLMGLPLALLRALLVQVKAPADWVIGEGPPVEWLPY